MALISDWFESDVYRVFTKVAKMRRDAVAGQLLTTYNERQVPHLQGQADGVKKLHEFFKAVNKEFRKEPDTK
jgi:hypothetical protein